MDKKTIKDLKVGESCIISNDRQANPKLGAKLLSDGRASLFLDYYFGFTMVYSESQDKMVPKKQKRREILNLYLYSNPRTPQQRQENKETLALADKIRRDKADAVEDEDKKEALKKVIQMIKAVYSFAIRKKLCINNPAQDIMLEDYVKFCELRTKANEDKAFSEEEIEKLRNYCL